MFHTLQLCSQDLIVLERLLFGIVRGLGYLLFCSRAGEEVVDV